MDLRGSHADRYRSLNTTGENQWMPGQNRNVTYITRLQALQAAVDHQLEQLAKDHPTRKAALISFNSEVITRPLLCCYISCLQPAASLRSDVMSMSFVSLVHGAGVCYQ